MRFGKQTKDECDKAITAIAEGNNNALLVLYRNYGRLIYTVAKNIVNNADDAEDVLQETLLRIIKYANDYQSGTNPAAWVLSIARNCANNLVLSRTPSNSVSLDDDDFRLLRESIADSGSSLDELSIMHDALHTLSTDERTIIKLKFYVGLSHKEIASVMGIDHAAARKRYQRALEKLKNYYKE